MISRAILIIAYMLVSSLAATRGDSTLAAYALILLLLVFLLRPLQQRRVWAYAVCGVMAAGARTAFASRLAPTAIFLPPIVINGALAWQFGHTLFNGNVPLVTRLVRIMHANDAIPDPAVWGYTRRVTACWTGLFGFNLLLCLCLALVGTPNGILDLYGLTPTFSVPIVWWSFFSDIGCYILVALLFLLEYSYRRRRFPWQPYRNIFEFLRHAIAAGPVMMAQLADDRKGGSSNR